MTLAVGCYHPLPHEKASPDSGIWQIFACHIRNPGTDFCFWIPESGIVYIEIWKTAQGIRNPSNDWISESKFHWYSPEPSTGNLELIQDCLVFPYMVRRFNAGRYLFRFRRLPYCGKQQQLFEDFKKLAILCGTKCEFCLETLLAWICWRMGCKNISLTM